MSHTPLELVGMLRYQLGRGMRSEGPCVVTLGRILNAAAWLFVVAVGIAYAITRATA